MNHLNTARKSHAVDSQREPRVPFVPWGEGDTISPRVATTPGQRDQSRVVRLGVDDGDAERAPLAGRVAAYDGDYGGRHHAVAPPALHVGGVEPDVGRLLSR